MIKRTVPRFEPENANDCANINCAMCVFVATKACIGGLVTWTVE